MTTIYSEMTASEARALAAKLVQVADSLVGQPFGYQYITTGVANDGKTAIRIRVGGEQALWANVTGINNERGEARSLIDASETFGLTQRQLLAMKVGEVEFFTNVTIERIS